MSKLEKLTALELSLIPNVVEILEKTKGEENAKTNSVITDLIFKSTGIVIGDARFRKMVRYIRVNNLIPFLASSSKGYYVETNKTKMYEYIVSLENRAETIRSLANVLRTHINQ